MNTASAVASSPQSFKEVWLISAGHGLTHWYTATFYLLLPLIGKELGLSYTEIGLIMTIQHFAGAVSNLPGGMIVDTVGQKGYLMAASLFWVGVPYAFMSITHDFWMLLVCVTLVGIGNNIWHPAALPTLAYRYPERKGLVLAFHGMGGNMGEAIAPIVVGALLAWFSWRTVVVINVVPGITMALLILLMLGAFATRSAGADGINASGDARSVRDYLRDYGTLLRNKALMLVSVSAAFRTMTQAGLLTFLPVYLAYELGYSPFVVGISMALLQVAGFIAGPIGGHLSDRMGRRRIVMSSMLLTGVMLIGMVLAGKSVLFVVFVALVGFFLYAMRAVLHAWAIESTPKNLAGSAVGIQFGVTSLGASVSPLLFGAIADATSVYMGFYFLAGTIICANLLVFFMPDTGRTLASVTPGKA
ncbi:MAG TPA: MFS transporter [Burkholderiales bacterium]|nr:MFS transporter [Burkholderiales bacterium]